MSHFFLIELTGVDCDAVEEWSKIVELARRSNVRVSEWLEHQIFSSFTG